VTPSAGDYDVVFNSNSHIRRIIYGVINPQGKEREVEVTPGPSAYHPHIDSTSRVKRIILGHIDA